ncbi:MAG: diaminopimelate decarboxylase, partial [Planctomycetota bacterium]|nr:diaminopimelate decarboxylase [Planctomycetota bacterium]
GNKLYCEGVAIETLAQEHGTPPYVYSQNTLTRRFQELDAAMAPVEHLVCFAVKSNSNQSVLRTLANLGGGFDIVSGGELYRVIAAGGDPSRCCYAGVAKTDVEIRFALEKGIRLFNVESEAELENLARLAAEMGKHARAALRVNPDVDPKTHRYVATGKKETKFGVDLERAERVFRTFVASPGARHVALEAIHLHIGSQITTAEPYVQAITNVLDLVRALRGAGLAVTALDIGGGFGADYETGDALDADEFAKAIIPLLSGAGLEVIMEPGRFIAGNSGILVTQVQYLKAGGERKFVIIDSGMHQLIRPALYGSYHHIWPVEPGPKYEPRQRTRDEVFKKMDLVDVVGPICESTDFFARDRHLPPLARGDLLAVFSAGAYGMTMASEYNSFPRPAEVLVEGGQSRLIRRRGTYEDLIAPEKDV